MSSARPNLESSAGQLMTIQEGPFAGFTGRLIKSLRRRVRVAINYAGERLKIQIDRSKVATAVPDRRPAPIDKATTEAAPRPQAKGPGPRRAKSNTSLLKKKKESSREKSKPLGGRNLTYVAPAIRDVFCYSVSFRALGTTSPGGGG